MDRNRSLRTLKDYITYFKIRIKFRFSSKNRLKKYQSDFQERLEMTKELRKKDPSLAKKFSDYFELLLDDISNEMDRRGMER